MFADPSRDESLIFELLEFKPDVADHGSAAWFLQDLAREQDAEGTVVCLHFIFIYFTLQMQCCILAFHWYIETRVCFFNLMPTTINDHKQNLGET